MENTKWKKGFFHKLICSNFVVMAYSKTISPEQAMQKARHYCAYQERCHQEVREKLYGFGLAKNVVEQLLCQLIDEDYINEERFARQFTGGKFRMKGWGRTRIKNELRQRQVSDYCIRIALTEISDSDYEAMLEKLATAKWESLSRENESLVKMKKLQDYLLYKGYEWELVQKTIKCLH